MFPYMSINTCSSSASKYLAWFNGTWRFVIKMKSIIIRRATAERDSSVTVFPTSSLVIYAHRLAVSSTEQTNAWEGVSNCPGGRWEDIYRAELGMLTSTPTSHKVCHPIRLVFQALKPNFLLLVGFLDQAVPRVI